MLVLDVVHHIHLFVYHENRAALVGGRVEVDVEGLVAVLVVNVAAQDGEFLVAGAPLLVGDGHLHAGGSVGALIVGGVVGLGHDLLDRREIFGSGRQGQQQSQAGNG